MSEGPWFRFGDLAAARPQHTALVQGDHRVSRADLRDHAAALAAGLDLEPGARVVMSVPNGPGFAALVLGIWHRGAIPVLVNAEAPVDHVAHAAHLTEAAAVICTDPGALPGLPARLMPEPASGQPPPPVRMGPEAIGSIVFTSGSTGKPKGVVQRAATLMDGAARVGRALGYRSDDSVLCPIPFAFDYGWGQLLSLLFEGVPLVLPETPNAFGVCAALARERPTVLAGVPALFAELTGGLSPLPETPRDSIRLITNTGSKIPDPIFRRLDELFPEVALSLNYGLTETYRSATLPSGMARSHPQSVGYALEGATLLVLRDDGSVADPEEEGEIHHLGAGLFEGYWNEPARTAAARIELTLPSGARAAAMRTGDFGRIDAEGRLYIHGRRDRLFKCMGVRVSPDEVEALLFEHPQVAEAAIVTEPHDMWGAMIHAHVVPEPGCEEKALLKDLKRHARSRMSPYMQPRIYHLHAALPRTPSNKVDYPRLLEMTRQSG